MKYLTVAPDYTGSCIIEDFDGRIDVQNLGLPIDFIKVVETWHSSYREIIPLNEEQRLEKMDFIETLDREGVQIAKKLEALIHGGAKVKYFSEGKLKYLSI
jgi:hypothetical protein